MGLSEAFVRHIGHRAWLAYKRESALHKYRRRFQRLWRSDREELDVYRLKTLRNLLAHAATTSPFYQKHFTESRFEPERIKAFTDLQALPFLTKRHLNTEMDLVLSRSYRRDELFESSTGGSSGVPLSFYRDRRVTLVRRAQDYHFNSLIDVYPGTRRAWVWGSEIDAFSMRSFKAKVMNFLTERAIYFYSFDATPESMSAFLSRLNRHRPRAIFAYPNMLAALAEYARQESINVAPIAAIVTTAEPLYDFQRQLFQQVFGARVFERYGSREIGTVAAEKGDGRGLYLFEPSYYFEVIDSEGKQVLDGETGELVVTDFFNYAMPLIRYRTGDMVRIEPNSGKSEIAWRRLAKISGRVVDLLVRPDGSRIAGQAMIMLLRQSGIRTKVQVVQNSPDRLTVKYLTSESIDEEVRSRLRQSVIELFRAEIELVYEAVEKLDYDKSGKYRYVTSECN